jgi:hypothetical protein
MTAATRNTLFIAVLRLFIAVLLLAPAGSWAQEPGERPPEKPVEKPAEKPAETPDAKENADEPRSTGLPPQITWTANIDMGWGSFGFANSLFTNPKEPGVDENLSDQWFEGYIKPALSATYTLPSTSILYGTASVVGERTYGSVPEQFGHDVSSFGPEDLYVGWKSGKSLPVLGENALDFTVGRSQYKLGHGFLLYDGSAEGGSRGGYWTNARKAFQFSAIGRLKPGAHTVEMFYLDKDELDENDSGTRLWGSNYEFQLGTLATIGTTYMKLFAKADVKPGRDGLNVFNVRTYATPFTAVPHLSFEFEYASERNGDILNSNAWTLQGGYELKVPWKPKVIYRYAYFQGDDTSTPVDENFDPLLLGFSDWGTWWQGEIAGEYFLSNSNLKSHMVRVHVAPLDRLSGGLLFFNFSLDQPEAFGPQVTDSDAAFEINAYSDWKLNRNFTLSFILAYADPGKAVQQSSGRTKNFTYGMTYIGYSF